jgi:hypothetical protein
MLMSRHENAQQNKSLNEAHKPFEGVEKLKYADINNSKLHSRIIQDPEGGLLPFTSELYIFPIGISFRGLIKEAFSISVIRLYDVEWMEDRWLMNKKGFERKWSWLD